MCSKANRDPPLDIMNLMSHKRYNYALREKYMARQIVDGVNLFGEHQNFIGFFGEDHIFEILRYICEIYSKENPEIATASNEEERFKVFLRQKEREVVTVMDEKAKEEHTNKFAMIAALFQRT